MTPIDLVVEEHFHRAAPGGMGGTKAAGNYSPVSASICCFWTAASAVCVFAHQAAAAVWLCCCNTHTPAYGCVVQQQLVLPWLTIHVRLTY